MAHPQLTAELIEMARKEERERCAVIVRSALDGHGEYIRSVGEKIVKLILEK